MLLLNAKYSIILTVLISVLLLGGCAYHNVSTLPTTIPSIAAKDSVNKFTADSDSYRQYLISGDFNGDGYLDNAYAGKVSDQEWMLFIHLDVLNDNGGEVVMLEQHTPDVDINEVRLATKPAGVYATLCSYSSNDCSADHADNITLEHDGILLVVLEASASIIYYDKLADSYTRIWLSD